MSIEGALFASRGQPGYGPDPDNFFSMSAQAHGADIRCDLDAKCSRRLGVPQFPASLAVANLYSQTRKFGDRNSVGLPSHDFGFHLFPSRPCSILFSPKTMIRSMVIDSSQSSPYALLLLELVQTPVSPHRPECAVHGSQQPRLIFPEPDSEWPRVVWDLRHDA